MNSSADAEQTLSPEHMQLLFAKIKSSWLLDSLYLFVLTPLSAVSIVLNMLSFATLSAICGATSTNNYHKALYQYLRIHSLNSMFGLLVIFFSFVSLSPRYFAFALGLAARYYRCMILSSVTTLYFFKNVLDMVIALERLSLLVTWLRRFRTKSPQLLCLGVFVACALVNSPSYFIAQPKSDADFFNITTDSYPYCEQLAFFKTNLGKSITMGVFVVRDLVPIVVEITFSVLAVQQLRRFRREYSVQYSNNLILAESERQLIVITLYILIVSLAIHLIIFLLSLSFTFGAQNVFGGWLTFLATLSALLGFLLNFFIIYFHSRVFRHCLKSIVRRLSRLDCIYFNYI